MHQYRNELRVPIRAHPAHGTIDIKGALRGRGVYISGNCRSGFKARDLNETLLKIEGDNSHVERVCFNMNAAAGTQTDGYAVWVSAADSVVWCFGTIRSITHSMPLLLAMLPTVKAEAMPFAVILRQTLRWSTRHPRQSIK